MKLRTGRWAKVHTLNPDPFPLLLRQDVRQRHDGDDDRKPDQRRKH